MRRQKVGMIAATAVLLLLAAGCRPAAPSDYTKGTHVGLTIQGSFLTVNSTISAQLAAADPSGQPGLFDVYFDDAFWSDFDSHVGPVDPAGARADIVGGLSSSLATLGSDQCVSVGEWLDMADGEVLYRIQIVSAGGDCQPGAGLGDVPGVEFIADSGFSTLTFTGHSSRILNSTLSNDLLTSYYADFSWAELNAYFSDAWVTGLVDNLPDPAIAARTSEPIIRGDILGAAPSTLQTIDASSCLKVSLEYTGAGDSLDPIFYPTDWWVDVSTTTENCNPGPGLGDI